MGTRIVARKKLLAIVVAAITAAGLLSAPLAAVADDSGGGNADAYYAAVAAASAGQATSDEDQNRFVAEGMGGSFAAAAASDADPSRFVDGDLVSDAVFFKGAAWSAAQIQSFLTTKGAGCAATAAPKCLKSFTVATPSKAAGAACSAYTGGTQTAAQIFAAVGVACGVNPVVLIALVQKEQGLVSTSKPTQWMYDHATGWNCPDVGSDPNCDNTPTSTGFFNQVFGAAWQFKQYGADPYFNWIPVHRVKAVQYNTDASCGTKRVAIWNKATAALYYYTPYTPNAASLASYPGEGDGCSAYGIRNFWMLFNAWYGSSTAGSLPSVPRISGADRYATAAAISRSAYPTPGAAVPSVFLANGLNFPDALAAAPAAPKLGGPLLLVQSTAIPTPILTELNRLKPKTVYVAGGATVISAGVVSQLGRLAWKPTVKRLGGSDRFQTAQLIAKQAFGTSAKTAYLTSGLNFPDALSAGGAAGANGLPVILVNGIGGVDPSTVSTLKAMGITAVKLVGGTSAISAGFAAGLTRNGFSVKRLSGSDRFETSVAVNTDGFPAATPRSFFASGMAFPDALAGAAWAGKAKGPLLVSQPGCVTVGAANLALRSPSIALLGGTAALGSGIAKLSVCQ